MKSFHVNRLRKLANFLDNLPRKNFDMRSWVEFPECQWNEVTTKEFHKCGSTACAFGWACTIPSFKKAGLKITCEGFPKFDANIGFYAASKFFGLKYYEAEYLFDSDKYEKKNATPKQVKQRILKFLKQKEKDNVLSKN